MQPQHLQMFAALLAAVVFVLMVHRRRGQHEGPDLVEYALMAAFVFVAAAAIMPQVSVAITHVFDKVAASMEAAAR